MAGHGTVFLMYHELALPGRPVCHREPGYTRYVVPASDFRNQMSRLATEGWRAVNVGKALQSFDGRSVCVTFDDGCETDLLAAVPVLKEFGFGATSYITVEFLGKPGYLSHAQVRDLTALGIEIGCHSLTHPYLTEIDDARLVEETAGAKDRLEQIAGVPVEHYSCPGGRWDRRVAEAVKRAKFLTMATSRTGVNFASTDRFALTRVAVLDGVSVEAVMQTARGRGMLGAKFKEMARAAAKGVLGNSAYDSLRGLMLGRARRADSEDR
ncbi:MAG TPA: polysaccharide deacetylase family protein [Candidatus Dormibacteraeota bacterium]|nr:polysaccharide deacetylase family protein [Candidatus Dormibacteraeota bacterium]